MKILMLAILISLLSGCTTDQCAKAKLGLATAEIGIAVATSQEQWNYWEKYRKGARDIYDLYCGPQSTDNATVKR